MTLITHPILRARAQDESLFEAVEAALDRLATAEHTALHRSLRALQGVAHRHRSMASYPTFSHVFSVLDELEERAKHSDFPPQVSLRQFWQIHDPSRTTDQLVRLLSCLDPAIRSASAVVPVFSPAVNPSDDPESPLQLHLGAQGVNALPAWAASGADGKGVGLLQVEKGFPHLDPLNDLPDHVEVFDESGVTMSESARHHAAGAMGIVCAQDNTALVIGIAPQCDAPRMYRATSTSTTASALARIAADLHAGDASPGDIVLLEVSTIYPIEADVAVFHAIRLCSALGLVVIEPSANFDNDLDVVLPGGGVGVHDSGAIMVGCSTEAPPYVRPLASGYGSRVDCFAWGRRIVTTNPGSWDKVAHDYGGTSGAAAIVAGAAVLTQHMAELALGFRLSPASMRRMLSDPSHGTVHSGAWDIGVMPDLKKIWVTGLGQAPDLVLRDNVADAGDVPSLGNLSASPDIWVQDPSDPTVWPTSQIPPAEVTAGKDLEVHVRIQNRGTPASAGSRVTVYYSEPASLVAPPWKLIGETTLADTLAPADGIVDLPPIPWAAGDLPPPGHYCFIGVIDHPDDPDPAIPDFTNPSVTGVAAAALWQDFVRNNNNIAWRNFNVVPATAGTMRLTFRMRALPGLAQRHEFEVRVSGLPNGTRVIASIPSILLRDSRRVPDSWRRDDRDPSRALRALPPEGATFLGRFHLELDAAVVAEIGLEMPAEPLAAWRGPGEISVVQSVEGRELGRITWSVQPDGRDDS